MKKKVMVGGEVYFSGSVVTAHLTKSEMENAPVTFSNKGARMMRTKAGDILIFGGTNMSVIKPIWEEVEELEETVMVIKGTAVGASELPEMKEQESTVPRTEEEIMAEMIAKSDCDHKGKLVLYRQHTAKGIRYFPKCTFCGRRERYVSESKIVKGEYKGTANEVWTEADIIDAIDWIED